MTPTVYQKPEIRDANDNIIQQGAFGKNTALANATNDGWIDYVANDLEFLYDLAKDEVVPVPSLPASGQTNKTYLLTTTGVSYRWSGTEWVAVSSSEAVGRAESAANLAEQWATKTDGTVDGTEYSAKYYAEQAEASADDAQDVADDMADHLVQIDKNTGGVSANSKRISNIEKLLQGNLYDYDTDDDSAYTKTVPSGALPYAGIEQIGGKTIVWNQLNDNSATNKTTGNVTIIKDADNRTWTANGTSETNTTYNISSAINYINGHKYLLKGCPSGGSNSTYRLVATNLLGANDEGNGVIVTCSADATGYLRVVIFAGYEASNLAYTPQLHDLTALYGAGNEPSTVAEFEAMFPADWYPYNAGTLLSAGVTEVESVGVNRLDIMHPWYYGNSFYNLSVGAKISGNSPTITITDNGDGSFSIPIGTGWYGVIYLVPIDDFATNAYRFKATLTGNRTSFYVLDKDYTVLYKYNDTSSTQNWNTLAGGVNTAFPQTKYIAVGMGNTSAGTIVVTNPSVAHSTITEYTPYMERTMPIPAEVRALEGYGWSAGSVSNYIDFERKVFVKRVGAVDLGTLYWTYSVSSGAFSSRGIEPFASYSKNNQAENVNYISDKYELSTISSPTNLDNNQFIFGTSGALWVKTNGTQDITPAGMFYYALATPIETDISAYLTDNLIEVGAGGTITFPNQNGADYHIPVPSTETYMIDLQEAISNG